MKRFLTIFGIGVFVVVGLALLYFFVGSAPASQNVTWGVNFSAKHAAAFGLDWRMAYTALLDDLGVRNIKVSLDWDMVEPERDTFSFANADWEVAEAEKRDAKLIVVVGMKTMRWPECHIPEWAKGLSKQEQQKEILQLLEAVVSRYKDSTAVSAWQVENEPLFPFGGCPWRDRGFLEQEVELVRSLDPNHPVVVSDSGELSLWLQAGRIGDIASVTMYRKVWFHEIDSYVTYPLPATFYARKAKLIGVLFDTPVMGGELQGEPWGPGKLLYDTTIEEQDRAFDLAQFRENIEFARNTSIATHYLWGAEWWFWRKEKASDPTFWAEAEKLFNVAH